MRASAMSPLVVGLVLLLCSPGHASTDQRDVKHVQEEASTDQRDVKSFFTRITALVKHVQEESAQVLEQKHSHHYKSDNGEEILEIFPRDLRKKEKFLKHLTGPLYFSPKCRKHVYRLYHNTRDCTIPAYFKRCARLLTRLAGSPRCKEG